MPTLQFPAEASRKYLRVRREKSSQAGECPARSPAPGHSKLSLISDARLSTGSSPGVLGLRERCPSNPSSSIFSVFFFVCLRLVFFLLAFSLREMKLSSKTLLLCFAIAAGLAFAAVEAASPPGEDSSDATAGRGPEPFEASEVGFVDSFQVLPGAPEKAYKL